MVETVQTLLKYRYAAWRAVWRTRIVGPNVGLLLGPHGCLSSDSVRTGHPRFLDKLYTGADPVGKLSRQPRGPLNGNSVG